MISYSCVFSASGVVTELGPEIFNIEFLGKETGTRLQLTAATDNLWTTGRSNDLNVDMSLKAYWSNVSKISATLVVVKVEKLSGGLWKSIGVDLSPVQAEGTDLQIEQDFHIQPEEPWEAAYIMVETSLSITYLDQREVSLSPFYIPHGRLGPISIHQGSGLPVLPSIGLVPSALGLVALAGILVLIFVAVYMLGFRRRGDSKPPEYRRMECCLSWHNGC